MKKTTLQQLFVPFLLLVMVVMLAFILKIDEPYPAIYQPSFGITSNDPNTINVRYSTIHAFSRAGEVYEIDNAEIFPFSPKNWDVRTFYMLPDTSKRIDPKKRIQQAGFKNMLKQKILFNYDINLYDKRQKETEALKNYMKNRVDQLLNADIERVEFNLINRASKIREQEVKDQVLQQLVIHF